MGILERLPLKDLKEKSFDIYKHLTNVLSEKFPEYKDILTSIISMHKLIVQMRFHSDEKANNAYNFLIESKIGRMNNSLDYNVNKEEFIKASQHAFVGASHQVKARNNSILKAVLTKIIYEYSTKKESNPEVSGVKKVTRKAKPSTVKA